MSAEPRRTVLVTGAARGIGLAIATRFLRAGDRVVAVDRDEATLRASVEQLTWADVEPVAADLTQDADIAHVTELVAGGVDVLVNNAGITRDARLVKMSEEDFRAVIGVNLGAGYRLTTALRPLLREGGAIVNMSSRAYLGNFGQFNYSMSKGGLIGLTRALALELAPHQRVNAIAPGLIATDMAAAIPDDVKEKLVAAIPLGRMGRPEEVAELAYFLGTDASSYITGQVIVIGGGRSLS